MRAFRRFSLLLPTLAVLFLHMASSQTDDYPPQVIDVTLVDVNTGKDVIISEDDDKDCYWQIDLAKFPLNASFTLRANTVGLVDGVNFTLFVGTSFDLFEQLTTAATSALRSVDTLPQPFVLGGKTASGQYKPVPALVTAGIYALEITPLSGVVYSANSTPYVYRTNFKVLSRARVVNFTLVDASRRKDISPIFDVPFVSGFSIFPACYFPEPFPVDPLQYPNNSVVSIRANTLGQVGSVEFQLYRKFNTSIDANEANLTASSNNALLTVVTNRPPFAIRGYRRGAYIGVAALQVAGDYILRVNTYRGHAKTGGLAEPPQTIDFFVYPRFHAIDFTLVNANTGQDTKFSYFFFGPSIPLRAYPTNTAFDVRANVVGDVGSVEFALYSTRNASLLLTHVDNEAPFSLGQPTTGRTYGAVPALSLPLSYYDLTATPYSGPDKGGIAGRPIELRFFVERFLF